MKKYFIFCAIVMFFSGCAGLKPALNSGFLNDYSHFKESEVFPGVMVDKSSGKDLDICSQFIIPPVLVYFSTDSKGRAINPQELSDLTDAFNSTLLYALKEHHYDVVSDPGPGVCVLRTALTEVIPNKVALNIHWSTTLSGAGIGGAALEAEFLDSLTDQKIITIKDVRKGKKSDYFEGWKKWGHTTGVFRDWSEMLIARLDALHPQKGSVDLPSGTQP